MWFNYLFPCGDFFGSTKKKLAKYENNIEWQNTFVNMLNIATYQFEWSGLPDTCNERFLELALITRGVACLVNDSKKGYLTLMANPYYNINVYGQFTKIRGIGWNGSIGEYTSYLEGADNSDAEAVLCRDNNMMYPYIYYIMRATDRLTSAMRSIDVASKKLKNPYFISCDESQQMSVKKILEDVDDNQEAIVTSKSTYSDMFKVFPTNVDINIINTLWQHYNNLDNQIRTILGIDNNDRTAKQERLLVDEVNANNMITDINIAMRLHERELFCKYCNETFPELNISVKLREVIKNENADNPERTDGEEGSGLAMDGNEDGTDDSSESTD